MKKNRVFIAAGTLSLAIAGVLTTTANKKKYGPATSAYYHRLANTITLFKGASTTNLTTTFIIGKTAFFRTGASGANVKLFAMKSNAGINTILSRTCFVAH